MIILLLALLIGAVAGLRTFTAPTAVSWAAHLGWLSLGGGPLAFLGFAWTPWILTLLALVEWQSETTSFGCAGRWMAPAAPPRSR